MTTVRTPIKIDIKRKPIRVLSKKGYKKWGGWHAFAKPTTSPPAWSATAGYRLLWCPYCGHWTEFKRRGDDPEVYDCTGICGWSNTKDFYVRSENNLWYEGIPIGNRSVSNNKKVKTAKKPGKK